MDNKTIITTTDAAWWAPEPERELTDDELAKFSALMRDRMDALSYALLFVPLIFCPPPPPVIEWEPFQWKWHFGVDYARGQSFPMFFGLAGLIDIITDEIRQMEGWAIIQQSMARLMLAELQKPERPPTAV